MKIPSSSPSPITSSTESAKPEPKTHYVKKMIRRRISSFRSKSSTSPDDFATIVYADPPKSPNISECDSESDSDVSCFSSNSILPDSRNTSYNSTTTDSSPISLRTLKYQPFLPADLATPLFPIPKKKKVLTSQIFQIPEILEIILHHVAVQQEIPTEPIMTRRAPLSRNHSILMHGEKGVEIWEQQLQQQRMEETTKLKGDFTLQKKRSNLHNCLLVNKLWYYSTQQILHENIYFKDNSQLQNFSQSKPTTHNIQPYSLILHKTKSTQALVDVCFENILGTRLSWIEFYITPNILPPMHLITNKLQKLVIPGCRVLTDDFLIEISRRARNLKHLDIRACDQITDASIYQVAKNCPYLQLFNCGRHKRGDLISDVSIGNLIQSCQDLKTVGLAGCGISDWSIWELALNCESLQRLSVNNCWKLTDVGLCRAMRAGFFENLTVLEIRNLKLNQIGDLVLWKNKKKLDGKIVLIEACERIDTLMDRWVQ
ncbi:hypothetical protein CANINC_003527 [Pichia inconspicua]|uniref:Antagonist of mitotic exit network protein 1 n=1 Tax=Pichia inconspicua TaxID=52247 RepID=A0A4V6TTQ5_9ASCO|nr:hypothetical protein CANINC_003527 [[Candida] inconspicua]